MTNLWKFSRPHTIIGTTLSVVGLYLIAFPNIAAASHHIGVLLIALIACLCGNVYIVGLNQLTDVDIDKINKPNLPLASGELSLKQGQIIVIIAGIAALVIAWFSGLMLLAVVGVSLALGTAYSLPPLRLKRFPFWASFCIFTVRGVVINLGLFLHYKLYLPSPLSPLLGQGFLTEQSLFSAILGEITPQLWALSLFVVGFAFAIAIFKDIPDIEGDKHYQITTLTIKIGAPAAFNLALYTLTACYLGMVAASWAGFSWSETWLLNENLVGEWFIGAINPVSFLGELGRNPVFFQIFVTVTHLGALGWLWWRSQQVNLEDKTSIASCYQFIWKLFFLEYLIFPAACLLA
ncbi:MAG TPA: homogentisate phytyltransferase [Oscillatoriaceae cyanobacterium M33_DOE_052]|uniref:Homogentisate phytyltransferase n=1 Tax=Planktothricoides sp. SpSt-374 TaxID=2282167 RepID=A0A7C3VQJ7_9CYAN|nr:homogentisate phytyltransferase [Oscillatoriaceae cyanobacterium M33_DOE_052]